MMQQQTAEPHSHGLALPPPAAGLPDEQRPALPGLPPHRRALGQRRHLRAPVRPGALLPPRHLVRTSYPILLVHSICLRPIPPHNQSHHALLPLPSFPDTTPPRPPQLHPGHGLPPQVRPPHDALLPARPAPRPPPPPPPPLRHLLRRLPPPRPLLHRRHRAARPGRLRLRHRHGAFTTASRGLPARAPLAGRQRLCL